MMGTSLQADDYLMNSNWYLSVMPLDYMGYAETVVNVVLVLYFIFSRENHESSVQDDNHSSSSVISQPIQSPPNTGRKTRNSNGPRGGTSSRPGLRSAKTNKSDTEGKTEVFCCLIRSISAGLLVVTLDNLYTQANTLV